MRAYHRLDPLMDERKGHYTPAQLGAFVKVQLLAGRQTQRGWFRSVAALRGALPTAYAKHVEFLVAEGDLTVNADGRVYLDGWDEWQEGDLTVRDRMARLRNRKRNSGVTLTVTAPSPAAIGVGVGSGVGVSGAEAPSTRDPLDRIVDVWLSVKYRLPTERQRAFLHSFLQAFDQTGEARAERAILANPHDPIAVMKAELADFRGKRAKALEAEAESAARRKPRGLTGVNAELAAFLREKDGTA